MSAWFGLPVLLLSLTCLSYAQKQPAWSALPAEAESATRAFPPQLRSDLAKLRDAALSDEYAYKQLSHLTDSIGPRPQGSPQADAVGQM